VHIVVGSLLVLAGLALVVVAVLGARSVLRRNRWVGVRTPATLASETQFVAGNRAAAVPVGAAGFVAAVGGVFLLLDGNWVIPTISLLGTLGFSVIGGLVGQRAAELTPAPAPFAASCGGACAGCDLIAGCRDAPGGRPTG
jgi:hypothetical protein